MSNGTRDELAKISREQISALRPVWQTDLVTPNFAPFADLCGGRGFRVDEPEGLGSVLSEALRVDNRPSLVEVNVASLDVSSEKAKNVQPVRILSDIETEDSS